VGHTPLVGNWWLARVKESGERESSAEKKSEKEYERLE